ncbi:hypothetical protein CFN78_18380 [Amycolatopsis antarctica]|uniref:Cellulose-binding protein n=1 Tax=Amycolatopsis antarctica TaxID=1854586 RepID=A0A263D2U3_9PSEU|nr:hypothetical protein [Amycolatopsis antarctica]OZM71796.1 hypothetical protein CFN78_18380 [Amycolatopsis antarctica]
MVSARDGRQELIPLKADFDVVLRGYDRTQVQQYADGVEAELRLVTGDRDAEATHARRLAWQLEELRTDNRELRATIGRISRSPIDSGALQERLRHMLELAREEADETTERAQEEARRTLAEAERSATALTRHLEQRAAELNRRAAEMEAEHTALMDSGRARVAELDAEAERRRTRLDQESTSAREQAEADLTSAITTRRQQALDTAREREQAAATLAERTVRDAGARAHDMVAAAESEVRTLRELREQVARQLSGTRTLLSDSLALLEPDESTAETTGGGESPPRPGRSGDRRQPHVVPHPPRARART